MSARLSPLLASLLPALAIGSARAQEGSGHFHLVVPIAELNVPATADNFSPTLTPDELYMVFASNRPGGVGAFDLYETSRPDVLAPWAAPVLLGNGINTGDTEYEPCLSFDGLELYFVRARARAGISDIWVSQRAATNQPWGAPQALPAPVNQTFVTNEDPHLTENGLTLFFTSVASGSVAHVFTVTRTAVGQPWTNRQQFMPTNSPNYDHSAVPDANGTLVWFGSNRAAGTGSSDWYVTYLENTATQTWSVPLEIKELNSDGWESNGWHGGVTQSFYFSRGGNGSPAQLMRACSRYPVVWSPDRGATVADWRTTTQPVPRAVWNRVFDAPINQTLHLRWCLCEAPQNPTISIVLGGIGLVPGNPGFLVPRFDGEFLVFPLPLLNLGAYPIPVDRLNTLDLPIPNDPALVGNVLQVQSIYADLFAFTGVFSEPTGLRFAP